tara:strand:+ start:761 stop:1525 length:765 start_codon:yes stop_codon:yes gene_type:complete
MIDSHCHLDSSPLFEDLSKIIKESKDVGIKKLLTICTSFKSFNKILDIIEIDPIIYGTFGIHPHETSSDIVDNKIIIKNISKNKKLIGIGETGLDFFYNHSDRKTQINSFKLHIEAALEMQLPIIVHSRGAEKETFDILKKYQKYNPKILMHCFTGSKDFSEKLISLNSYFSASGIITFKNSVELQNTFKEIPLEKLLIETDSPYLAPVPKRGKSNEPSYIKYTLEKLCEIKSISFEEGSTITSKNFENLFLAL